MRPLASSIAWTFELTVLFMSCACRVPTLFLSECVLIYMKEEHSAAVVRWASTFNSALFVTYEQILPDDAFGRMMLKNLQVSLSRPHFVPFLAR